jgi:hypothetical protein
VPSSENNEEIDGIELLRSAYSKHKDVSEVVKQICSVFKELCNYGYYFLLRFNLNLKKIKT